MGNSNRVLTKTCKSCGLQKPLTAFVLKAGTIGAAYGDICSTCRQTSLDKKEIKETEEGSTRPSGAEINHATKLQTDFDKSEHIKRVSEDYYEEREKNFEKEIKISEKTQDIARDEKKQREKRSFFNTFSGIASKNEVGQTSTPANIEQKQAIESNIRLDETNKQTASIQQNQQKEQAVREEQQAQVIDPTQLYQPAGIKQQSPLFLKRKEMLLGTLVTEKAKQQKIFNQQKMQQEKNLHKDKSAETKDNRNKKEESLVEYVKNTWLKTNKKPEAGEPTDPQLKGPNSGRRR